MLTREDIEAFLDRLGSEEATYREIEPGLWAVRPGGALDLDFIVHYNPPVVVLRVKVMDLPSVNGKSAQLNRRLLELNATGARARTSRFRRIPGQLRKHDTRPRDPPARAVHVQRGTLGNGHLRSLCHTHQVQHQ
jgi:hypothetical protein